MRWGSSWEPDQLIRRRGNSTNSACIFRILASVTVQLWILPLKLLNRYFRVRCSRWHRLWGIYPLESVLELGSISPKVPFSEELGGVLMGSGTGISGEQCRPGQSSFKGGVSLRASSTLAPWHSASRYYCQRKKLKNVTKLWFFVRQRPLWSVSLADSRVINVGMTLKLKSIAWDCASSSTLQLLNYRRGEVPNKRHRNRGKTSMRCQALQLSPVWLYYYSACSLCERFLFHIYLVTKIHTYQWTVILLNLFDSCILLF